MVNGVRNPEGSATALPSTRTPSTVGAPMTTVTGPVTASECCSPGSRVASKSVAPEVEFVTSTQQRPEVADRARVKLVAATS